MGIRFMFLLMIGHGAVWMLNRALQAVFLLLPLIVPSGAKGAVPISANPDVVEYEMFQINEADGEYYYGSSADAGVHLINMLAIKGEPFEIAIKAGDGFTLTTLVFFTNRGHNAEDIFGWSKDNRLPYLTIVDKETIREFPFSIANGVGVSIKIDLGREPPKVIRAVVQKPRPGIKMCKTKSEA